jgi:Bpu10I restriction endonuclease
MYVHGDNLKQKEEHKTKYIDAESKLYLQEIRGRYDVWRAANEELKGPFAQPSQNDAYIITERTRLFNEYKDFVDQQRYAEKLDSRSNLHSSVLEEFMYYLFKDLVKEFSAFALLGKAHAFKDLFFSSPNFKEMVTKPHTRVEKKDHDFVIGINVHSQMHCAGSDEKEIDIFQIPAVAIECKTYLDKTMLEGSSAAADQLRYKNPNAMYILVAEWLKLSEDVNLSKYRLNQVYILRKQKNTDREFRYSDKYTKYPIFSDVVEHLFETVRTHLTTDWEKGIKYGLDKGYLL